MSVIEKLKKINIKKNKIFSSFIGTILYALGQNIKLNYYYIPIIIINSIL